MKPKNLILAATGTILSLVMYLNVAQAVGLPDLTINGFQIDRLEWQQMPDFNRNPLQDTVWKAHIEFHFTVLNQGQAPAWIANNNWESSGIEDSLFKKSTGALVGKVSNVESVPNNLAPGSAVQLVGGRMFVEDINSQIQLQGTYTMCLNVTDRPSDNQNWFLQESNNENNKLCFDFILDMPKHDLPNPSVIGISPIALVFRHADGSADFPVQFAIKNKTRQVYIKSLNTVVQFVTANFIAQTVCNGANINNNMRTDMHGLEIQNPNCTVHLPAGTPPGLYSIRVIVDPANQIIEANENDNVMDIPLWIL